MYTVRTYRRYSIGKSKGRRPETKFLILLCIRISKMDKFFVQEICVTGQKSVNFMKRILLQSWGGGTISLGFHGVRAEASRTSSILDMCEQYIFVDQFKLYGRTVLTQRILNCARSLVLCWL